MARKTNPTLIGAFVLAAAALVVLGIGFFGQGQFFSPTNKYVLYFEGALNGLSVGSPVLFRGVKVGEVTELLLHYHLAERRVDIPVYIEIDPRRIVRVGGTTDEPNPRSIKPLIDRGLRARLAMQSFVTGQLAVQLDFHPETEAKYVRGDPVLVEIPTIPSALDEITKTLQNLPLEELMSELRSTVQGVGDLVRSEELRSAIRTFDATVADVGKLARHADERMDEVTTGVIDVLDQARVTLATAEEKITAVESTLTAALEDYRKLAHTADENIGPLVASVQSTAESARTALEQARSTLSTLQQTVGRESELHVRLAAALEEITAAARAVRGLADYLERYPEALIKGKSPAGG